MLNYLYFQYHFVILGFGFVCDFFQYDLQSSTYKIIVVGYKEVHIYSSSSHFWQTFNDSFSNFISNLQYKLWNSNSCITYKNNIYVLFHISRGEWMIAEYNPMNDIWNNINVNIKRYNFDKDA